MISVLVMVLVIFFSWLGNAQEPDLFTQAQIARQNGEVDQAYDLFEQAAQKGIRPHDAYYEMGLILMEKEQWVQAFRVSGKAAEAFQDFLEKNPQDDNSWFRLAYIYEVRSQAPTVNEWNQAIEALQKALAISPENTQYLLHLGYTYYKIGNNDEAERVLLGILEKHPEHDEARYFLAMSYLDSRANEKARQQFNYIVNHAPQGSNYFRLAEKELTKMGGETQ